MDAPSAKRLVVMATAGSVGITTLASLQRDGELPSARLPLGAMAAGIMLAVLAEFWPSGAGGFAIIMLLTTALTTGADAWKGIAGRFA